MSRPCDCAFAHADRRLRSAKWTTGEKDGDAPATLDQATIEMLQEQLAAVVALNEDCPICFTALAEKTPVRHALTLRRHVLTPQAGHHDVSPCLLPRVY